MNNTAPASTIEPIPLKPDFKADFKLAIGPFVKKVLSLTRGSLSDKKLFVDSNQHEKVSFHGGQGNLISAYFYPAKGAQVAPGILLLHGSTPEGKQMGLYRLLGYRLADLGYAVLSIDQRGHGRSEDPKKLTESADLDFAADAKFALGYLKQRSDVDAVETYVLGHSFGGDVAIAAGSRGMGTKKILAYGPGRRYEERVKKELAYFCRRFTRYMGLSEMISAELYFQTIGSQMLELHQETYAADHHVPLMLIDGELESQSDRDFLKQISAKLSDSVVYQTIPQADHYANVAAFGRFIVYDQRAFDQFVSMIDRWFTLEKPDA